MGRRLTGEGRDGPVEDARASFEAGDYGRAADLALGALAEHPDDVSLLRLVGKARLESGHADAAGYLRRAVDLDADDADAETLAREVVSRIGRG